MSVIDKKPFINKVLDTLTKEEMIKLNQLVNGDVNNPVFSSLLINSSSPLTYDALNTIREATIEVDRNKGQTIYNGYLIYNSSYCVLISYANKQTQQLQLIKMVKDADAGVWNYYVMPCNVSVTDLRMAINDALIEAGEVENVPSVIEVDNIREMTNDELDGLKPGDMVIKKTGNQKHTYIVSYKGEGAGEGICLSYCAAGYTETVSYDRSGSGWVYNSTDIVPIGGVEIVELDNLSGTLSDADYEKVSGDNCLIKMSTQYFYKEYSASTLIVYSAFSRTGTSSIIFENIEITKADKTWEYKAETVSVGGIKFYLHQITIVHQGGNTFEIITTSSNPIKLSDLSPAYLPSIESLFLNLGTAYKLALTVDSSNIYIDRVVKDNNDGSIKIVNDSSIVVANISSFTDTVTEL